MAITQRVKETAAGSGFNRRGGSGNGFYPDNEKGDDKREKDVADALKKLAAVYKQMLPTALDKAVKKGVPKDWAKKYFDEFFDEQCDEERVDMDFVRGGPSTLKTIMSELKSFMKGDDVVADYGADNTSKGIDQVKQAGEKLFKNPSQKVKILQKMGLTGPEFHAFCLMVKEQIK